MTSRRDFLKGFAALASGLALAPADALASVQRLGTPQQWVESGGARFERLLRAGPVVGQHFVIDRPIAWPEHIDVEHCSFELHKGAGAPFLYGDRVHGRFNSNTLDFSPQYPGPVIAFGTWSVPSSS